MTVPKIYSYVLPSRGELPANVASWLPDLRRAVLLLHDMQQYFLDFFPPGVPPLTALLENARALRSACAEAGVPVVYTAQPGDMKPEDRGLLMDFWGPGMSSDESHRRIADQVAPAPGDRIFGKWRYSAFHRTGLLEFMRESGRDQLIVAGVYAHVGCLMTVCDALAHDIQAFLVADAVADFDLKHHRMALGYAAERAGVVLDTSTLLTELVQPSVPVRSVR